MRNSQPSKTAQYIALARASESLRPKQERLIHDSFAVHFLSSELQGATDRKKEMALAVGKWSARFPGVRDAIIVRTRFIDDCLQTALSENVRQVVILGAGYDTRAFRFTPFKKETTIFEIDHPWTQSMKLERIKSFIDEDIAHVRYVPMDFTKDDLKTSLTENGYDNTLKTLFIWEGVNYYLPRTAVDQTLAFMVENSAPKSGVVFDYFPQSVINGTTPLPVARELRRALKNMEEELLFGLEPRQMAGFMAARGFEVMQNLPCSAYLQRLTGKEGQRDVSEMFWLLQANIQTGVPKGPKEEK